MDVGTVVQHFMGGSGFCFPPAAMLGIIPWMSEDGFEALGDTIQVRIDSDLVRVRNIGVFTLRDMTELLALYVRMHREHAAYFVIFDCSKSEGIDQKARKSLTQANPEAMTATATVIVGASFPLRTVTNMIVRALRAFGRPPLAISFLDTDAQARAYIDQERQRARTRHTGKAG